MARWCDAARRGDTLPFAGSVGVSARAQWSLPSLLPVEAHLHAQSATCQALGAVCGRAERGHRFRAGDENDDRSEVATGHERQIRRRGLWRNTKNIA
jgi:hypothetical protein